MDDVWGLLRLSPQCQDRYLEHMRTRRPHVKLYYPQYCRVTRPRASRDPVKVLEPVYPGYIFVRLDCRYRDILDCPIRLYFVRFGGNGSTRIGSIGTVTDAIIVALQDKEKRGQLVREEIVDDPYKPGRIVRVHTPVTTIGGLLVKCTHSHTRAVVDTVMGPWEVPIHQVELV